jgi:preprotein translocase subunit SecF
VSDRNGHDDGSSLDDVPEEDVEELEAGVDTDNLDEDELVSLDDAARALLAKPRRGHGPIARLYRGETRFDFVGRRRIWFSISTVIIALGIISIVLRGGLNLGIEFKGGTEWQIAAPGVTQAQAVDAIKGTGVIDPTVELLGTGSNQTLDVQSDINHLSADVQKRVSDNVVAALTKLTEGHSHTSSTTATTAKSTTTTSQATTTTAKAGAAASGATSTTTTSPSGDIPKTSPDKISITTVGPTWGSSITNKAIEALIIFFIVVAIYISIRFEPKMALSAFIAMVHDVLVAVGIYSIFNFQVTPDTVVAILTILGYSLYDTVVVFDRVRDNTRGIGASGRMTYPQLINLSMNQTLARSINTSAVAILPVLAVLLIGAQLLGATTLQSYGLALFVGLLSGAYSSIFIASPVLCLMKEREDRWVAIANRLAKRGEVGGWYSAADAAAMTTQMSMAAAGQVGRAGGGGGPAAAQRSGGSKRSGPIRPGSGSRSGSRGGAGTGTAVMDRPAGGAGSGDGTGSGGGASSGNGGAAVAGKSGGGSAGKTGRGDAGKAGSRSGSGSGSGKAKSALDGGSQSQGQGVQTQQSSAQAPRPRKAKGKRRR